LIEKQNGLNQLELHEQSFVTAHDAIDAGPNGRKGGRCGREGMPGSSFESLVGKGLPQHKEKIEGLQVAE
jgi:hypothetical protein